MRAAGIPVAVLGLVLSTAHIAQAAPAPAPTVVCAPRPPVATLVASTGNPAGNYGGVELSGPQVDAAATIVNVGLDQGMTRRGIVLAVAAAMSTSQLDPGLQRGHEVGLFRQAADRSTAEYTQYDRSDAVGAARMFFGRLISLNPGYDADARADWEIVADIRPGTDATLAQWIPMAEAVTTSFIPVLEAPPAVNVNPNPVAVRASVPQALRGSGTAFAAARDESDGSTQTATTSSSTSVTADATTDGTVSTDDTTGISTGTASTDDATTGTTTDGTTTGTTTDGTPTDGTTTDGTTPGTTTDPATTDPATTDPATTDPTTTDPSTSDPTTTDPSTSDPTTTTDATPVEPPPATDQAPAPDTSTPDSAPAVVDTVPPPPTSVDPGNAPDVVSTPAPRTLLVDCAPDGNGGSTAFDPGNIISDAVFYNSAAMSAGQIQSFVTTMGTYCLGDNCLKNLTVTTGDIAADRYCDAYTGGVDEPASAVIAKIAVACGINPQVMLVTLQKESTLLTRTAVGPDAYRAAWGWHCPDTGRNGSANCDPRYSGFFNQAYGMAKQWSRYRLDPQKYPYRAGQTTTILWNVVQSGCGGSTVTIENNATAALYNYTPYQPNAAAIAAYPGVGDACSAYGNRNFFFLFQKYFGTTGGGADAQILVNGVQVSVPDSPYVSAALRGAVLTAPNEAVAAGLAGGFAALGLPYVWGGGTGGGQADQGCARGGGDKNSCAGVVGYDCSGLTAYVLTQAGYGIGTNSGSQRAGGVSVPWNRALPGDIVGFPGHVAIYLGVVNGTPYLLEAPNVGGYVQIRPLYTTNGGSSVDAVVHRYWS